MRRQRLLTLPLKPMTFPQLLPAIMPSDGGWTLVVASRTNADEASSIRDQFGAVLQQSAGIPVDVLESETGDGTMRYRVIVGQFSSQSEAQRIKQEYSDVVPGDAWPLQL